MSQPMNFSIADGVLTITCKIGKDQIEAAPPSSTGKTKTIATTGGYNWATGVKGIGFNLTVSAKA